MSPCILWGDIFCWECGDLVVRREEVGILGKIGELNKVVLLWWNGEFSVGWFGDFCGWVWWNDYTFCGGQPVLFWWKITPIPKNITVWLKGDIFWNDIKSIFYLSSFFLDTPSIYLYLNSNHYYLFFYITIHLY